MAIIENGQWLPRVHRAQPLELRRFIHEKWTVERDTGLASLDTRVRVYLRMEDIVFTTQFTVEDVPETLEAHLQAAVSLLRARAAKHYGVHNV